jgi:hypothetical protein
MSAQQPLPPQPSAVREAVDPALARRLGRLGLATQEDQWTERYLLCQHLVDPPTADSRQRFEATSRFIRDLIAHRWVRTRHARENATPKRIHYLSMESASPNRASPGRRSARDR